MTIKLAFLSSFTLTEVGSFIVVVLSYAHKRVVNQSNQVTEEDPLKPQVDEIQKKIEDMSSQVSAMSIQAGIKKMGN